MANVGVHSYIITIRGQYSVVLWLYEFVVLSSTTGVDMLTPQMIFLSRKHSSQRVNRAQAFFEKEVGDILNNSL